jgi:hypothetical protein
VSGYWKTNRGGRVTSKVIHEWILSVFIVAVLVNVRVCRLKPSRTLVVEDL